MSLEKHSPGLGGRASALSPQRGDLRHLRGICVPPTPPRPAAAPPPAVTHSWRPDGAATMLPIRTASLLAEGDWRLCDVHPSTPDPIRSRVFRVSINSIRTSYTFPGPLPHMFPILWGLLFPLGSLDLISGAGIPYTAGRPKKNFKKRTLMTLSPLPSKNRGIKAPFPAVQNPL